LIPCSDSGRDDVEPEMNQRSSAMTARRKTRFVVRSGRTWLARLNRRLGGAKREMVPVPVLRRR
jgi:hypothetical protein